MTTLLLPCAGKSSRYPGVRPKWMLTTPDGSLAIQKALGSVPPSQIDRVVIAIRQDHDENFGASTVVKRALGNDVDIVVIEHDTNGPAETVSLMIERAKIKGAIAIKDADSFFHPHVMPEGSFVAVSDLRECLNMSRVGAKSFITINEQGIISGIVEKSVTSNFVSSGLYGFADAGNFQKWLAAIHENPDGGEIFVSHIIYHAISCGEIFFPHNVHDIVDVGTLTDWLDYTARHRLYIVDIDGVVFNNQSEYFPPYWGDEETPIQANVDKLCQLQKDGAQLVFVTSRNEKYRDVTQKALERCGLRPHALVMGAAHAARILINDFAASNPYPSAQAINITRNSPDLPRFIP